MHHVQDRLLWLGDPEWRPLPVCESAYAGIVTVKGYTDPDSLREYLTRQLAGMGVEGTLEVGERRVVWVRSAHVVGFGVRVSGMPPLHGHRLLSLGLGGRRRFGCGVFLGGGESC